MFPAHRLPVAAAVARQVAHKFVDKYGRSPWGLFWALGCFSGVMTVVIPDDIVTMTMTPVTIRMCHLLNLPEIPFLFSQFFAVRRRPAAPSLSRLACADDASACLDVPAARTRTLTRLDAHACRISRGCCRPPRLAACFHPRPHALGHTRASAAPRRRAHQRPYAPIHTRTAPQGNIWAVTLVTGNPTNVLLAEDLGNRSMVKVAVVARPWLVSTGSSDCI